MTSKSNPVRRVFAGKETGIILGVLIAGSLLISGGFVPTYLAILLASGVRNTYLASLGSGMLFYTVAFVFLYLQAVVLSALYLGFRHVYLGIKNRPTNGSSV